MKKRSEGSYKRQEMASKYGKKIQEFAFTGTYDELVAGVEQFAEQYGGCVVVRNDDGTLTCIMLGGQFTIGMGNIT